jgi:DNA (cytosine-5)-methyltransferase 1
MLRAIREIQPTWVVGENVRGLTNWNGGMVFDEVQADLEAEGYEVTPFLLPACAVNAPHRRDRIWFIAYSINRGHSSGRKEESGQDSISGEVRQAMDTGKFNGTNISRDVTNTNGTRAGEHEENIRGGTEKEGRFWIDSNDKGTTTNTEGERYERRETGTEMFSASVGSGLYGRSSDRHGIEGDIANTGNQRLQGSEIIGSVGEVGQNGNKFFTGCLPPTWEKFPTQSPICNGDDGLSSRLDGITFPKWRNESIKAGGNAIVPQVALQIFKSIQQYENNS